MTVARASAGGFTLLEVLVALSLVGVLMVVVYTGLHIGLRSWDAVQARSQSAVVDRATRNWLRRQIGALVPLQWREGKRARIAFAGDARGFRFLGFWTHATRGGGLYQVDVRNEEADGAHALVLAYQTRDTERPDLAGVGATEVRRLDGSFASLRFDYFGAPTERDPRRWRRTWPNQADRFPELIRISAERRDTRPWPQLVVAVRSAPAEGLL